MSDIVLAFNHGATLSNDILAFESGAHTAVEPIALTVSVEQYALGVTLEEPVVISNYTVAP